MGRAMVVAGHGLERRVWVDAFAGFPDVLGSGPNGQSAKSHDAHGDDGEATKYPLAVPRPAL